MIIELVFLSAFVAIFGYAILWAVPAVFVFLRVSLGSGSRIAFYDEVFARSADRLHSSTYYGLSAVVGARLLGYWLRYPIIRKRGSGISRKMDVYMWLNCVGVWSWLVLGVWAIVRSVFLSI